MNADVIHYVWDDVLASANHHLNELESFMRTLPNIMNTPEQEACGHLTEARMLVIAAAQKLQALEAK